MIHVFVPGVPVPQGSLDVFRGRIVGVKKPLAVWRDSIRAATMAKHDGPPLDGPLEVTLIFQLPRPRRPRWPLPAVKPDADKLTRAVFDSLSTLTQKATKKRPKRIIPGVIVDDARIVNFAVKKVYHDNPGVFITIMEVKA